MTRYDGRPPARIDDLDAVHVKGGGIRQVNRLKAWIEVRDERIVDAGYRGPGGFLGSTRLDLGFTEVIVRGRARPHLRRGPAISRRSARFIQTVAGRTDDEGSLIGETTDTNFGNWFATYYGTATPWGGPDLEPLGLQEIAPQVERAVA